MYEILIYNELILFGVFEDEVLFLFEKGCFFEDLRSELIKMDCFLYEDVEIVLKVDFSLFVYIF